MLSHTPDSNGPNEMSSDANFESIPPNGAGVQTQVTLAGKVIASK